MKLPNVVGGVGQVFPTHWVAVIGLPFKFMVPELPPKPVKVTTVPEAPEFGEIIKKLPEEVIVRRTVTVLVPSLMVIE